MAAQPLPPTLLPPIFCTAVDKPTKKVSNPRKILCITFSEDRLKLQHLRKPSFAAHAGALSPEERLELQHLRKFMKNLQTKPPESVMNVSIRKSPSDREKQLRNLVRTATLRRFDAELANPDSLLYKKNLVKGEPGTASRYTKYSHLWVELFQKAARPTLEQILQDAEVTDWTNVSDIYEAMKFIIRERRKNHMSHIKKTGKPKDLLYQEGPLDKPLNLKKLFFQLTGSRAKGWRNSSRQLRFLTPVKNDSSPRMRHLSVIKS